MECLEGGELSTAASYLIILQASLYSLSFFLANVDSATELLLECLQEWKYKLDVANSLSPFAAVGSARELFMECLEGGELSTVASYLIILQASFYSLSC